MVARSELEVVGDAGTLHLSDPWHSREPRIEIRRPDGTESSRSRPPTRTRCELEDFAAAVRGERPHPFGRATPSARRARSRRCTGRRSSAPTPCPRRCYSAAVPGFERAPDPDRPGQLLLRQGEPIALVFWVHDYEDRVQTGWFMTVLDEDGEPDGRPPTRLAVAAAASELAADRDLGRADWLARAQTVELVTAGAAVDAAERALERMLGGSGG